MDFEEDSVGIEHKLLHSESEESPILKTSDDSLEMNGERKVVNRMSNS